MCKIWYLCWSVGFLRFIYTRLHQSDQRDNQRYRVLSGEKLQFCPRMFRRGLNRFASCLQGVMTHMGTVEIHSLTPPTNINAADLLPAPRRLTRTQNSRKTVEKRGRGADLTVPGRRLHKPNALPLSRSRPTDTQTQNIPTHLRRQTQLLRPTHSTQYSPHTAVFTQFTHLAALSTERGTHRKN